MNDTNTIINKINSFDSSYMMSDDSNAYKNGERQENEIHSLLKDATNGQLLEIKASIDLSNRFLAIPFGKYFEGLTQEPKSQLSQIMKAAWEMFKAELFPSFAKALKAAWAKFKLISKLKAGIARFTFTKSNGEVREAIGTLRNGNFQYQTKGNKKSNPAHVVKYFDIVSNGWRSFRLDRLIEIA